MFLSCLMDHLLGLVVKGSASGVADPGFDSCLGHGDFSRSSHTSDFKIGTPVATYPITQMPGIIGSALGLTGLVSVHCDWVG